MLKLKGLWLSFCFCSPHIDGNLRASLSKEGDRDDAEKWLGPYHPFRNKSAISLSQCMQTNEAYYLLLREQARALFVQTRGCRARISVAMSS